MIIEPDMAEAEASQVVTYVGVEGGMVAGDGEAVTTIQDASVVADASQIPHHRVVEYKIMHTTHDASGHEVITAEVLEPVDEVAEEVADEVAQEVVPEEVQEEEVKSEVAAPVEAEPEKED